ncbi:Helix-turn-helix domain protein [compost metagenome]
MNYSELLSEYIEKSGLTLGEIATKIQEEQGISIDRSYISMLKNNKTKNPASDEINRALAEVTGGDPESLILAAYYQKAPKEVQNSMKFSEHYRYFKNILMESDLLDNYFAENNEENIIGKDREDAIDTLIDSLSHEEFIKFWQGTLIYLLKNDPQRFREIAQAVDKRKPDPEYLYLLEKLRRDKQLSIDHMADVLSISPEEYKLFEVVGGFGGDSETAEKYRNGINYLEKYQPEKLSEGESLKSEFEEFINNPEHGIFFKDYLSAPEERRAEMRQIFNILQSKEKDRKPGDKQDK